MENRLGIGCLPPMIKKNSAHTRQHAIAINTLVNTLPLSDSDCRVNPILVTFGPAAEILLTTKEIAIAEVAPQVKLTVELIVVLTD